MSIVFTSWIHLKNVCVKQYPVSFCHLLISDCFISLSFLRRKLLVKSRVLPVTFYIARGLKDVQHGKRCKTAVYGDTLIWHPVLAC